MAIYHKQADRTNNICSLKSQFYSDRLNLFIYSLYLHYIFYNFINLSQVHNFTVNAQNMFYLQSTSVIYYKFYRNLDNNAKLLLLLFTAANIS